MVLKEVFVVWIQLAEDSFREHDNTPWCSIQSEGASEERFRTMESALINYTTRVL
jgi:hypothetical protein